jgi:hypothetical protein
VCVAKEEEDDGGEEEEEEEDDGGEKEEEEEEEEEEKETEPYNDLGWRGRLDVEIGEFGHTLGGKDGERD